MANAPTKSTPDARVPLRRIGNEVVVVLTFVGLIWMVFFADLLWGGDLSYFGLRPRQVNGLLGIFTMPFLHNGWSHILSNTVPLLVLLVLLAVSRANSWLAMIALILAGGALLWLCGRGGVVHVGASGLIFGLIAFLVLTGLFDFVLVFTSRGGFSFGVMLRAAISALVAVVVLLLYGGSLVWGVLPMTVEKGVSWDGHLCGAVAGALLALPFALARHPQPKT